MAVYRWIYANAKMEGNKKDYHVRICDPALENYKQILIRLSNRLLSTNKRYGEAERQVCWFAGYLDEKIYVVAMGGDQKALLGVSPDGYRSQHCVLAYGFTGADARLYKKSDRMFEPLKEIMREIQQTGRDIEPAEKQMTGMDFSAYVERPQNGGSKSGPNIRKSTEENDDSLWKQSLQRPAMTGIISVEDAKKLLQIFPGGSVTVIEDVELTYHGNETKSKKNVLRDLEEREEQKKLEKEKADKELEELQQQVEASKKELEKMEAAGQKKNKSRALFGFVVLLIIILLFLAFLWTRPFREWAVANCIILLSKISEVKAYYLAKWF